MGTKGVAARSPAPRTEIANSHSGSFVIVPVLAGGLPARLLDSRDETVAGHVAEADAADAELAIDGAGSAAYLAASLDADTLAGQHLDFVRSSPAGLQFFQL